MALEYGTVNTAAEEPRTPEPGGRATRFAEVVMYAFSVIKCPMTLDALLNDFAIRSFRDVADGDYIIARAACRSGLFRQFLWASQQTIEKYLKCILLLNRIPAREVKHDLSAALTKITSSGVRAFDLTEGTKRFVSYLDTYGPYRYLEVSYYAQEGDIVRLDKAVWEIRRYCTLEDKPRRFRLHQGVPPRKVRLDGGYLEKIIDDVNNKAREPLLWQNAFFGKRARKIVRIARNFDITNSPLFLHPEILDEVAKYVYLPIKVRAMYGGARRVARNR